MKAKELIHTKARIIIGIITLLVYALFPLLQNGRSIELYMLIYGAAFILMYFIYLIVQRTPSSASGVRTIIAFGLLFRLILFFSDISTSDDVYRYLWEGKLVVNGENPFALPPNSEELKPLHSELLPELVTFPDMTTIYPGVAQAVFGLSSLISGEETFGLKLIFLIAEFFTMLFIVRLLRLYGKPESYVILYAWLPLPIMEYFVNVHIDAAGIVFFIAAFYYLLKGKRSLSALLLALAVSVKLYALLALPFFIKKLGLRKGITYGITTIVLFFVTMLPFISAGEKLYSSLTTYLSSWSFNGGVYTLLNSVIKNGYITHTVTFAFLSGVLLYLLVKSKNTLSALYLAWLAYIIFAPTLYPWYLGWIAALHPLVGFHSLSSLFFLINFSNFTPLQKEWTEFTWVYLIEYIPFYLLLAYDIFKMKRRRKE